MTRKLIPLIALTLAASAYAAHAIGVGGEGLRFGRLGATAGNATAAPPPPTCSPGAPTGEMDFSVCSNIGITAALW
jgi:hypothetical protein